MHVVVLGGPKDGKGLDIPAGTLARDRNGVLPSSSPFAQEHAMFMDYRISQMTTPKGNLVRFLVEPTLFEWLQLPREKDK